MRKSVLALVGATALTIASAASATVTVTSSTGLNDPNPSLPGSVVVSGPTTTINFGQNPVALPTFSGSFTFNNTLADLYNIVISTSTPGITFSAVTLTGPGGPYTLSPFPDNTSLKLANTFLSTGTYTFSFTGNNTNPPTGDVNAAGALTGNVTITPLPEPATWAMMLLGFGAIGLSVRSRRKSALAQIA